MIGPEGLGGDIKEVLKFPAIRGKFSSVHPELRREGITKIEVGKEGLRFLRDSGEKRRLTKRKYPYIGVLVYWIKGLPDGSREPKEIVSRQKDTEEFKFYRRLVSIISLEDVEENEDRVQEAEDDMMDHRWWCWSQSVFTFEGGLKFPRAWRSPWFSPPWPEKKISG